MGGMTEVHAALLENEADQFLRLRQPGEAAAKLREALTIDDASSLRWMKLAATERALGHMSAALAAIEHALAIAPLDFMALLSRAHVLEQVGHYDAGEAYGRALANRPEGDVPDALKTVVVKAEHSYAKYLSHKERRLKAAADNVMHAADPSEILRVNRMLSNLLLKTRVYHSEPTHFHFPGLVEREFHERDAFPWLARIEEATDAIQSEFEAVAAATDAELEPYIQYADSVPLRQWRALNRSRDWTAIHMMRNGEVVRANADRCPITMSVLQHVPQPQVDGCGPNAMFSLLAPQTTIPPHTGVTNTRLVCHLPLIVPPNCWFRVGETKIVWKRGEVVVFDDSIEHEAANDSDSLRVVLIFDVWHPGLSANERRGVKELLQADRSGFSRAL